jgi:hypothetical protein
MMNVSVDGGGTVRHSRGSELLFEESDVALLTIRSLPDHGVVGS